MPDTMNVQDLVDTCVKKLHMRYVCMLASDPSDYVAIRQRAKKEKGAESGRNSHGCVGPATRYSDSPPAGSAGMQGRSDARLLLNLTTIAQLTAVCRPT